MKTKSGRTLSVSEIHREYRRTRRRDNAALCHQYGVTSVADANLLLMQDMHARATANLRLAKLCKTLEAATEAGDFALGAKLGRQIQRLKASA